MASYEPTTPPGRSRPLPRIRPPGPCPPALLWGGVSVGKARRRCGLTRRVWHPGCGQTTGAVGSGRKRGARGRADDVAVRGHDAGFKVGFVQDLGTAGHGLVEFCEGLCLGKTGEVAEVSNDQMGHGVYCSSVK